MLSKIALSVAVLSLMACASSQKGSKATTPEPEKPAAAVTTPAAPAASAKVESAKPETSTAKQVLAKKDKADAKATTPAEPGSCVNGKDQRFIELVKNANGGCELHYTKNGTASKVAEQAKGTEKCEDIQDKIKSKLEGAGFTCS